MTSQEFSESSWTKMEMGIVPLKVVVFETVKYWGILMLGTIKLTLILLFST